jgi:hypothetical protein
MLPAVYRKARLPWPVNLLLINSIFYVWISSAPTTIFLKVQRLYSYLAIRSPYITGIKSKLLRNKIFWLLWPFQKAPTLRLKRSFHTGRGVGKINYRMKNMNINEWIKHEFWRVSYRSCPISKWIILGLILERWDGVVWTGLVWLRIGSGGELLWIRYWTFGFHEMLRNYRVA